MSALPEVVNRMLTKALLIKLRCELANSQTGGYIAHGGTNLEISRPFYLIACGFSWLTWLPLILGPDGLKMWRAAVPLPVVISVGTLGPLLACFIVHRR